MADVERSAAIELPPESEVVFIQTKQTIFFYYETAEIVGDYTEQPCLHPHMRPQAPMGEEKLTPLRLKDKQRPRPATPYDRKNTNRKNDTQIKHDGAVFFVSQENKISCDKLMEVEQDNLHTELCVLPDSEPENYDDIKTLLPSLTDLCQNTKTVTPSLTELCHDKPLIVADHEPQEDSPSLVMPAILAIFNETMSRPELRNYLHNHGCPIAPTCDTPTNRDVKFFTMVPETPLEKIIELISNDLMVQDPSTKAFIYMPAPICSPGTRADRELMANFSASKNRQPKINPPHAVFVHNLPLHNADEVTQYFASRLGQVTRYVPMSSRRAILEFATPAMAQQAQRFKPDGKFRYINITSFRPKSASAYRCRAQEQAPAPDGKGGMDVILPSDDDQIPPSHQHRHPSRSQIDRHWEKTAGNVYVLTDKKLNLRLAQQGLVCKNVPGQGNCGWHAQIEAGDTQQLYSHYQALKQLSLQYIQQHHDDLKDFFCSRSGIHADQWEAWKLQNLLVPLSTDNAYIDEHQLVVSAFAQCRPIHVYDLYDTHIVKYPGRPPWALEPAMLGAPILLAYRQHKKYYAYDQNYQPIGRLEGHYMAIVAKQLQQPNQLRRSHRLAERALLDLNNFAYHTMQHDAQQVQA